MNWIKSLKTNMTIEASTLQNLLYSLLVIGAAIVIGLLLYLLLVALFKILRRKVELRIGTVTLTLQPLRKPMRAAVPTLIVVAVQPFLRLPQTLEPLWQHVLQLWGIGLVGWLAIKIMSAFRTSILSRYNLHVKDNLKARQVTTQLHMLQRVLVFVILVMVLAAMLMTFEGIRQIGVSILASAGIIGIIVGFAAQKSIATIIAGIQIAITQPIRLDDVVIVENEWGRIEEITLTYVVVKIWDERRLVLPITYFIDTPFQNWTRTSSSILGAIFIYSDYSVPIQSVREELARLTQRAELWDGRVCVLQVTNCTERTLELRALVSASNASKAWELRCLLREQLVSYLQEQHPSSLPKVRLNMEGVTYANNH